MEVVQISNLIEEVVKILTSVASNIEVLLAAVLLLVVTAKKLAGQLAFKKRYLWNLVPEGLPTLKTCRAG
jgi:hypothetical protein